MITVKDKNGAIRCTVEITDKCVYSKTLMEDEYVLLSFESDTLVGFRKKDCVTTEFGTFYVVDIDIPELQSDGGYLYEQKFQAEWCIFKNHILFYDRGIGYESSWKMTQRPEYFLSVIVSNLTRLGYTGYSYEIDSDFDEMKLVEFDASSIIDALTLIAEAWETDWWIEGKVIHLSKCEIGTPLTLTDGKEISDVSASDGESDTYMTRAYVFGSTRNLTSDYRKSEEGTVVNGTIETRLKLPQGTPYIDAWSGLKDEDIVEGVIVLDDVYPRNTGTISTISTKEYTDTVENADGTKTVTKWNAYRYTDADLTAKGFKEKYRIAGEDLRIVFQTGKLAGMDFVVNFNPDSESESKSESQVFEIVRNDDYGVNLPSDDFHPAVGDTYVLYGYDTEFVSTALVPAAENELLTKGTAKLAEYSKNNSVYDITANVIRCAGYTEDTSHNLVHHDADEIDMELGQAVTLVSSVISGGSFTSRVRSFEKRLDNKFNATYVIGESDAYSKGNALKEQLDELTYQSKQFIAYGNSVYVVKRYDTTAPSDTNVPSFKRAQYEFLQRNVPNAAAAKISFEKGLDIGTADSEGVRPYAIGADGSAVLGAVQAKDKLTVAKTSALEGDVTVGSTKVPYVAGAQGCKISVLDDGVKMQVDYLEVTRKMTAHEIEVMKTSHIGGRLMNSAASIVSSGVYTVMANGAAVSYVCFFEDTDSDGMQVDNLFAVGDQALCQTFNIKEGTTQGFSNQYYWRLVTAVSYTPTEDITVGGKTYTSGTAYTNCIVLSATDCATGSTVPLAGDEIVQLGNRADTSRQGAIIQSSTGTAGEAPYMRYYKGINSYILPEPFIQFSPSQSWINATEVVIKSTGESGVTIEAYVNGVLDSAKEYTDGKMTDVSTALSKVEAQLDESFYVYHGEDTTVPTLTNAPASEWTTEEMKAEHIGDFYVSSDGFCWQFRQDASYNYMWAEVNDRYLTAYVQQIGEKKRVFTARPSESAVYDVGDLWVNASYSGQTASGESVIYSNDMLVCITAKKSGEAFSVDHWRASSGVTTQTVSEVKTYADGLWAGSTLQYTDSEGTVHEIEKAGLVTTSNLAQLVVNNHDIQAAVGVSITNGISKASIKASQVEILSDHFKVLNGDVYADNLTLTGTFNNMLSVVDADDIVTTPVTCQLDGSPTLYGSPDWLCTGQLVNMSLTGAAGINLPFYICTPDHVCAPSAGDNSNYRYVRTATRFGTGVWHMMTLAEMRMMVGKTLRIANKGTGTVTVYYGVPFTLTENSDGTYLSWDGQNDYESIGVPQGATLELECRMDGYRSDGVYYECIWWRYLQIIGQPLLEFDSATTTTEDES